MAHKEPRFVGKWLLSSVVIVLFRNFNPLTGVKDAMNLGTL
jgi:hypothetical protein